MEIQAITSTYLYSSLFTIATALGILVYYWFAPPDIDPKVKEWVGMARVRNYPDNYIQSQLSRSGWDNETIQNALRR